MWLEDYKKYWLILMHSYIHCFFSEMFLFSSTISEPQTELLLSDVSLRFLLNEGYIFECSSWASFAAF